MSPPAASPDAAVRVPRAAAGRRALQLALLVGGLFALALVCGQRAGAAEGVGALAGTRVEAGEAAQSAASPPVAPKARPAHDLVGTVTGVTDGVARTVEQTVGAALTEVQKRLPPPAAPPVTPPTPPGVPDWPDWEVPDLPDPPATEPPGLPDLPGLPELPGPSGPSEPGGTAPAPEPGTPDSGKHQDGKGRNAKRATATTRTTEPSTMTGAHGPWGDPHREQAVGSSARGAGDVVAARPEAPFGYGPVRPAPVKQPAGVPGSRSSGDNSGLRYADAHAVSVEHRVPVRLVPGAAVRAESDETRDRSGDVPVSPA
ncbi:hypothetical protein [Streptomyces sp. IBSBF 3352]|uniref:hypothetical protein n=1 Tax=Streptomyces sp. IBSBF 3352 TaxID=2903523 RepID=UPI002FDC677D